MLDPYNYSGTGAVRLRAGVSISRRPPETRVDSELNFEWPERPRHEPPDAFADTTRPARRAPRPEPDGEGLWVDTSELQRQLDQARTAVARLEADRHAARTRIAELEAARDASQARATAQRRRLLVLERQLEGLSAPAPAEATPAPVTWLQRLL